MTSLRLIKFPTYSILECMTTEDSALFDKILTHIREQQIRAKLTDKSFDLGVLTSKQHSPILALIENNMDTLANIGMSNYIWHDDALRSTMNLAGEDLLFSICAPRS